MSPRFLISVRGDLPSDLVERISQLHAAALMASKSDPRHCD
jgi:hypothetical protein